MDRSDATRAGAAGQNEGVWAQRSHIHFRQEHFSTFAARSCLQTGRWAYKSLFFYQTLMCSKSLSCSVTLIYPPHSVSLLTHMISSTLIQLISLTLSPGQPIVRRWRQIDTSLTLSCLHSLRVAQVQFLHVHMSICAVVTS